MVGKSNPDRWGVRQNLVRHLPVLLWRDLWQRLFFFRSIAALVFPVLDLVARLPMLLQVYEILLVAVLQGAEARHIDVFFVCWRVFFIDLQANIVVCLKLLKHQGVNPVLRRTQIVLLHLF